MRVLKAFFYCILVLPALLLLASCQKYSDQPGQYDPRLARKYCNDPEAVNYNLNFPGTADNSVCFYPADVFAGTYTFADSIYNATNTRAAIIPLTLHFTANGHIKFDATGFCPGGGSLHFTANRALRATADTTALTGQLLCRNKDTVSGTIVQVFGDSTRMQIMLTVVSDTGVTTHQGTAYRQ